MSENTSNIAVAQGSERSFGFVFAGVAAIIAVFPLFFGGELRLWATAIAAAFLGVTFVAPKLLATPNRLWFKFGMFLGGIVAPIVMGIIYLLVITPFGLVMRLAGKKLLDTKLDPDAASYWIRRDDAGDSSMRNQF